MGSIIGGGGLDVQGIVSQLIYTMRTQQSSVYRSQQASLNAQKSAFGDLNTKMQALLSQVQSLELNPGPLNAQTVSTSDNTRLTATASGAVNGSYAVTVTQMARASNWTSMAEPNANTAFGAGAAGTLRMTQNGTNYDIVVTATDTINTLITKVNNAGANITASTMQDGTNVRLSITSTQSGAAQNITMTNLVGTPIAGLGLTNPQVGQDAQFTVNGQSLSNSSNVISGAIQGVTLTLINTTQVGSPVNLTVQTDTTSITASLQSFANAYNDLVNFLRTQTAFDPSGKSGALAGNTVVRDIQANLSALFNTSFASNTTYKTLSSMGIEIQTDGTLKLNSSTLNTALSNNLAEVQRIFQQIATPVGIGKQFENTINGYIQSGNGSVTVALQQVIQGLSDINKQLDLIDLRLQDRAKILTAQFSRADQALRSLSQLQSQLSGLPGF